MKIGKNLILGAKIAFGTLAAAGSAVCIGYALQTGGSRLQEQMGEDTDKIASAFKTLGETAQYSGDILFTGGRFVGYSLLLPVHTVGYFVPKWLIENGIPSSVTFERFQPFSNLQELNQFVQEYAGSVFAEFDKRAIHCIEYVSTCHDKAIEQCTALVQAGLVSTYSSGECVINLTLKHIFKTTPKPF